MKVIFSDMDGTLIFSNKRIKDTDEVFSVERYKEKDVSFMSPYQFYLIRYLTSVGLLIPTTARTEEELLRVDIVNDFNLNTYITSNGGKIHFEGKIDEEYDKEISEYVSKLNNHPKKVQSDIIGIVKKNNLIVNNIKLIPDLYVMVRFEDIADVSYFDAYLNEIKSEYTVYITGKKLYIVPQDITKERAVEFMISKYYRNSKTVGMGDTNMDFNFLKKTTYSLAPGHINFTDSNHELSFVSKKTNIDASEELLELAILY